MINVSENFKETIKSNDKTSRVEVKFGYIDEFSKKNVIITSDYNKKFTNANQTVDDVLTDKNYITCEHERNKLDGSFCFLNSIEKNTLDNENIGLWSGYMTNEEGYYMVDNFGKPEKSSWGITYHFSPKSDLKGLTLYFKEIVEDFDVDIKKRLLNEEYEYETISITKNNSFVYKIKIKNEKNNISDISIRMKKTKYPNRYFKFEEIFLGIENKFNSEKIIDYNLINEMSLNNSGFPNASLSLTIKSEGGEYDFLNPNNKLSDLLPKTRMRFYYFLKVQNEFKNILLGTYYLKQTKTSKNNLVLEAYDQLYSLEGKSYGSSVHINRVTDLKDFLGHFFALYEKNRIKLNYDTKTKKGIKGYVSSCSYQETLKNICEAANLFALIDNEGAIKITDKEFEPQENIERRILFKEDYSLRKKIDFVEITYYSFNLVKEPQKMAEITIVQSAAGVEKESRYVRIKSPCWQYEARIVGANPSKPSTNSDLGVSVINDTSSVNGCNIIVSFYKNIVVPTNVEIWGYPIENIPTTKYINSDGDEFNSLQEKEVSGTQNILKIENNTLITEENYKDIALHKLKLNNENINYDLQVLSLPYLESGDCCNYQTAYGNTKKIVIEKTEFSKSIIENFVAKGE